MNTQKPNKIGQYEVLDVLSPGGMGVVYRARDPRIGRIVAIKMLPESFSENAEMLQRFYRDISQTGALRHNNIVIVFEAGDENGEPYIVTELVEGKSLDEVIRQQRVPLPLALSIVEQVCSALAYAHRNGVIHRDIKPSHVILRVDGIVKLLDFGIARHENPVDPSLTGMASLVTVKPYMAPEVLRGEPMDGRSDIFSAGVLLYELLTGKLPFDADSPAVMDQILRSEPRPPSQLVAEYPLRLDSIVARALAKSPADRYANADDMAMDLNEVYAEITRDRSAELNAGPSQPELKERPLHQELREATAPAVQSVAAPEGAPGLLDQAGVVDQKRNLVVYRLEEQAALSATATKLRAVSSDLILALQEFPNDPALLRLQLDLEPRIRQVEDEEFVHEVCKSATELPPQEAVERIRAALLRVPRDEQLHSLEAELSERIARESREQVLTQRLRQARQAMDDRLYPEAVKILERCKTEGFTSDEVDGLLDQAKSAASQRSTQETRGNSMPFEIGRLVGDYEIVSMLGVGGMGQVYRVRNVISDRTEAMKVLLPDLVAEPALAARFISEIRMLAGLDHPNIALLHTALQVDNQLFMVMEFVEGFTLEQRAKQSPIPTADTIEYMQQVLSALSYAHSRGVVHRDIKPANIMVTSHGVIKLMDFGIAKSRLESDLTRPGTTMGSLYYMSPEQVRGGTVDARSDVYSTGVMMYELFAGRRPFEADSAYGILNQQCNDEPQAPVAINPQLPAALSDLILCAMAKDPANRFQSAQALNNALRQVATAENNRASLTDGAFAAVITPAAASPTAPPLPVAQDIRAGTTAGAFAPLVTPTAPQPMAPPPFAAQDNRSGTAAGAFNPVVSPAAAQPMAPPPPTPSSHRGAWIALGALAVLVVTAGAAVGFPYLFPIHAIHKQDPPAPVTPDVPPPVQQETPPPVTQGAPPPVEQQSPAPGTQEPPPAGKQDISGPVNPSDGLGTQPATGPQTSVKSGGSTGSVHKKSGALVPAASASGPTVSGSQPDNPKQPENAGPSAEEVDQAHEQMTGLDARAGAVSGSVESLKRQQDDLGVGLRQDMATAYARMNSYLRTANADLDSGNIAAARKHMDMADKEITILERFFGK